MNAPQRSCVVCRNKTDKKNLFRVVKYEGKVFIDDTHKANGRGAYICKNIECIEKAEKAKSLNRALECEIDSCIYKELKDKLGE